MEIVGNASVSTTSTTSPTPVVDGAVGVKSPCWWFISIVNSRHEKKIAEILQKLNVEAYVATQKEIALWANGRKKTIDRVVIPAKVFVKCSEKKRKELVKLPFINRFMVNTSARTTSNISPVATVPESEIQTLKFMLGQTDHPVYFTDTVFKCQDTVKVIRGKLKGLTGNIINNPDGSHDLIVNLNILGGASVSIDPSDVEKI